MSWPRQRPWTTASLWTLGACWLLISTYLLASRALLAQNTSPAASTPQTPPTTADPAAPTIDDKPSYLRLLYTQRTPDLQLCSSLFSALALGYPTPFLTGSAALPPDSPRESAEQVLDTYRYFLHIGPRQDEDLAVVVDGQPIWFQLKPDVLIARYFESIKGRSAQGVEPSPVVAADASDAHANGTLLIGSVKSLREVYHGLVAQIRQMPPEAKHRDVSLRELIHQYRIADPHMIQSDSNATFTQPAPKEPHNPPFSTSTLLHQQAIIRPFAPSKGANWHGAGIEHLDALAARSWGETPLLGSGGTIPLAIEAPRDPDARKDAWRRLWFYARLRDLMVLEARSRVGPYASASPVSGGREWWGAAPYNRGLDSVLVEEREALPLAQLCGGAIAAPAFGDGMPWVTAGRHSLSEG